MQKNNFMNTETQDIIDKSFKNFEPLTRIFPALSYKDFFNPKKDFMLFKEASIKEFYDLKEEKADYFNGFIIMNTPASIRHERFFVKLISDIQNFIKEKNIGELLGSRALIYLEKDYRFEPDIFFVAKENNGIFKENEFIGVPDLVIEILSKSTRITDLYLKRVIYKKHKIKEILFFDLENNEIIIDKLEDDYVSLEIKNENHFESNVIKGYRFSTKLMN